MTPDLLGDGAAWLSRIVREHATATVQYRRGAATLALAATKGRTSFDLSDGQGTAVRVDSVDFILAGDALDFGAGGGGEGAVLPRRGDRITDGGGVEHEVSHPANAAPYSWCDPGRRLLRVHTKRIGPDTP